MMKRTTSLPTSSTTSARVEIARALRHLHRLARAEQPHHLDELDVERHAAAGQRRDRRLDALDRARMVRAPYVDKLVGIARLLEMIGEIGPELGPASIGLPHRPVHIVSKAGGRDKGRVHPPPNLGK